MNGGNPVTEITGMSLTMQTYPPDDLKAQI